MRIKDINGHDVVVSAETNLTNGTLYLLLRGINKCYTAAEAVSLSKAWFDGSLAKDQLRLNEVIHRLALQGFHPNINVVYADDGFLSEREQRDQEYNAFEVRLKAAIAAGPGQEAYDVLVEFYERVQTGYLCSAAYD